MMPVATVPQSTKRKHQGMLPSIRPDMIARVAGRRADGLSLKLALALENPPQTLEHWTKALSTSTTLARMYEQKYAEAIHPMLLAIKGSGGKDKPMPVGTCWLLERSNPEEYATNKGGKGVTVNVNTVIGLQEDVLSRARAFASRKAKVVGVKNAPQALPEGE